MKTLSDKKLCEILLHDDLPAELHDQLVTQKQIIARAAEETRKIVDKYLHDRLETELADPKYQQYPWTPKILRAHLAAGGSHIWKAVSEGLPHVPESPRDEYVRTVLRVDEYEAKLAQDHADIEASMNVEPNEHSPRGVGRSPQMHDIPGRAPSRKKTQ